MDVSTIISRIATLSLNEDSPDTAEEDRIVGYINLGYNAVLRRVLPLYNNKLVASQSVTITSGSGTISTAFSSIYKVVDTTNASVLKQTELDEVLEIDPAISETGSPTKYYLTSGTTLNVHPKASITATVWYTPEVDELTASSVSADIKIPKQYQDILIEAALKYMYVDERDLTDAAALNAVAFAYEEKMTDLIQFLHRTNKNQTPELPFQ